MGRTRGSEEMRGAKLGRRTPAFLGRERVAVSVDVDLERRSPRYRHLLVLLELVFTIT